MEVIALEMLQSFSLLELSEDLDRERFRGSCRVNADVMKRKRSEIEDQLEQDNATLRRLIAAKDEEIQNLGNRLLVAEHRNSQTCPDGESFLDTGATPHLLNRAMERVNVTSGSFSKLLMLHLKGGGIDCTKAAKTIAKSVFFERDAHTKFFFQAFVCKILFADFENECFCVDENASDNLDPEQLRKENFQRYKDYIVLEYPEELIFEDAIENDFRRFCNKKRADLIVALSKVWPPGVVDDVGDLIFGEVFGPEGIRKRAFAALGQSQAPVKVASSFVKFALSVFLVHRLAFALHPIARISRVRDGVKFNPNYMESVVALADCEDDNGAPVCLSVDFMVIPGFRVNNIVVHSKVYSVDRA